MRAQLEELRDEEQAYFDNLPDSIQSGERGDTSQAAIDAMDNAVLMMEDVVSQLCEIE